MTPRAEFAHISDTGIIGILMAAMPALAEHHTNTHAHFPPVVFTAARCFFLKIRRRICRYRCGGAPRSLRVLLVLSIDLSFLIIPALVNPSFTIYYTNHVGQLGV